MNVPTIDLPRALFASLDAGHPWVYRDHVAGFQAPNGTWVRLRCGTFDAIGLWDSESVLSVRVYSRTGVPDEAWLLRQVQIAYESRRALRERGDTTAYRLIFGEGDGLPGIVADLYGAYVVLRLDTNAAARLLPWLCAALREVCRAEGGTPLRGIVRRHGAPERRVETLWGEAPPARLIVQESGFALLADVYAGQKTGLFLDHRENRRHVETLSAGLRVLNLFSYTGAFSLYAARGGASEVVSVDVAKSAAEAAADNLRANGFDPGVHPLVAADVFQYLEQNSQERFDLVICDPPSFARNKKQAKRAVAAYTKVNHAALGLLSDGGLLASASCTTQVGVEDFRGALVAAATRARKRLQIVHEAGQPLDHPVSLAHPEGRYLKYVVCRVRSLP